MIPASIWRAGGEIGPGAHRLLLLLWEQAEQWHTSSCDSFVAPTMATLEWKLGVKRRGIYSNLATLEADGWIRREVRGAIKGWLLLRGENFLRAKPRRKPIGLALRFRVLQRDNFSCHYCGVSASEAELEVDHITPIAMGGNNDIGNLRAACFSCNNGKRAEALSETVESAKGVIQ